MLITDWFSEEQHILHRFIGSYRENNAKNPENYPLDIDPYDWEEAYEEFKMRELAMDEDES